MKWMSRSNCCRMHTGIWRSKTHVALNSELPVWLPFYQVTWFCCQRLHVTESYSGWKGPLGPSAPSPSPAGPPRAGGPGPCPEGFGRSPRRRLQSLLDSLCQCTVIHTAQNSFLVFRGNLLSSGFCPPPFVLALGTTGKSLTLYPSGTCIQWWDDFSLWLSASTEIKIPVRRKVRKDCWKINLTSAHIT